MADPKTRAEEKLDALSDRIAATRAAMRAQKDLIRAARQKDRDREARIIGNALLESAKHPDFELMLKGVLKTTIAEGSSDYKFLIAKGWL